MGSSIMVGEFTRGPHTWRWYFDSLPIRPEVCYPAGYSIHVRRFTSAFNSFFQFLLLSRGLWLPPKARRFTYLTFWRQITFNALPTQLDLVGWQNLKGNCRKWWLEKGFSILFSFYWLSVYLLWVLIASKSIATVFGLRNNFCFCATFRVKKNNFV